MDLYIDVMTGRGSMDSRKEKMEGNRKGESSEGEHGEIKGVFQSLSLVGLFESRWLSAGMRTNSDKCDAGTGLHAKLCHCTHTHS